MEQTGTKLTTKPVYRRWLGGGAFLRVDCLALSIDGVMLGTFDRGVHRALEKLTGKNRWAAILAADILYRWEDRGEYVNVWTVRIVNGIAVRKEAHLIKAWL